MSITDHELSIGDVAQKTGLSVHTLRYYENEGLMLHPRISRRAGGQRRYGPEDVKWLGLCIKLRRAGMPLAQIRRYAELVRAGPGNEQQRLDLLREQQQHVERQLGQLNECLQIIDRKVGTYERALANGAAEHLYTVET